MARSTRLALFALAVCVPILAAPGDAAAPLGDCASEPGLAGRTDVVYCEPWESPTWFQSGWVSSARVNDAPPTRAEHVRLTSIEKEGCLSGSCLRVQMKQFVTTGVSIHWPLKNAGLAPEQLYMRYYLKLGPEFHTENCRNADGKAVITDAGGKLPGLADSRDSSDPGGQCGNGGKRGDGINCWSHRMGFRNCSGQICRRVPGSMMRLFGYLYFYGQEGETGNTAMWDRDPWAQTTGRGKRCASEPTNLFCAVAQDAGALVREKWYGIELFVKMNTPGEPDGIIRGWIDGVPVYTKTNFIFRMPGHQNLHVRTAWLDVYKGGLYGNCKDSDLFIDQMVLATDAPIGPHPAAPKDPAAK